MSQITDNFFRKLIKDLLPSFFRNGNMVSWLMACMKPLRDIQDSFTTYKTEVEKKMKLNGQTLSFEHYLNEEFPQAGGITLITDAKQTRLLMLGMGTAENQGFFAGIGNAANQGVFLGTPDKYLFDYDFIVQMPANTVYAPFLARLQSLVRKKRFAGKRFIIRVGTVVVGSGKTLDAQPVNSGNNQ